MYATVDDVKEIVHADALVDLVDDEREGLTATGELTTKQATRVANAIRDATSKVDAYVSQRYPLPLPEAPTVLRSLTVDIAVYNLFSRRGITGVEEVVRERMENAMRFLRDIALGKASLPLPDAAGEGSEGPVRQAGGAKIGSPPRLFSRDTMKEF